MTRTKTKWLLWLAAVLLLPLPYLFLYDGAVPVIRYLFLLLIASSYALIVDGSAMAWPMALILFAHTAVFSCALLALAALAARLIPQEMRRAVVAVTFVVGLVLALSLPIYTTPMDDENARTSWIGLFQ